MTEPASDPTSALPAKPDVPAEVQAPSSVTLSELAETPLDAPAPRPFPAWTGWDVLAIFMMGAVALFGITFLTILFLPGPNLQEKMNTLAARPNLQIAVQVIVYLVVLGCMYVVVAARTGATRFWQSIHWNWPVRTWPYVVGGLGLQALVLSIAPFLPLPKETPFSDLLKNPSTLVVIAIFSVTFGPLMEELFFRGFLYPVLARGISAVTAKITAGLGLGTFFGPGFVRRFGISLSVVLTGLGFGLVHARQYGNSWTLISMLFLVGVVIGWVRARKDSIAAGFLVHIAYNGVLVLALLAAELAGKIPGPK